MKLLTTAEAAARLQTDGRYVRRLAEAGRLAGARKHGRDWLIPEAAVAGFQRRAGGRPRVQNST